jgi:hypothetical protein
MATKMKKVQKSKRWAGSGLAFTEAFRAEASAACAPCACSGWCNPQNRSWHCDEASGRPPPHAGPDQQLPPLPPAAACRCRCCPNSHPLVRPSPLQVAALAGEDGSSARGAAETSPELSRFGALLLRLTQQGNTYAGGWVGQAETSRCRSHIFMDTLLLFDCPLLPP